MSKHVNQRDAAERLGLTTRQVKNLADLGMPTVSAGGKLTYPFPECLKWYVEYKVTSAVNACTPGDFEEAKTRKMAAEAELAEMELAQQRGDLVAVVDVGARVAGVLERVRARLVVIPGKLAPRLVGVETAMEARGVLEVAVGEVLAELAAGEPAKARKRKKAA